ncbi:serine/threonine-protein kinase CTR1 [Elysia marginata]|uniref:Serine/threonine-protein kinase CTR1 n=1 Tax=Elysia marginata TaxID=1093978 RepID=A0AAV4H9G5_9GAST|nr:serine/threonine-protein kinase CTR1 [Elysia marginata]
MMPRTYVDNAMNRRLGRVGMEHGSAVHSRGSSNSSQGFSGSSSISSGFSVSPGTSTRTYVDNHMNRSLGRVGLELGTAVHSRSGSSNSSDSSSSSTRTYVDNPMNQRLGRVGLALGSAPHSKNASAPSPTPSSSSSSTRTYVDNPMNQRLGRVGLALGSAPHSKNASAPSATPSSSSRTYVDNPMNQKSNSMGHSESASATSSTQSPSSRTDGKVYKDNDFNRKHNRVGLPLGSKPIRKSEQTYADNAINRSLNRAGLPMGTKAVSKTHLAELRKRLCNKEHPQEGPSLLEDSGYNDCASQLYSDPYFPGSEDNFDEKYEHVMESFNREREEDVFFELRGTSIRSSIQATDSCSSLTNMQSKPIELKDVDLKAKIGHGGFGEVWMAVYKEQVLAVKILTQANVSKKRLKLFENEILTHSKLDHPNIVKFYGPCLERPNLAIFMEYMDGSLWDSLHVNEVEFLPVDKLNIISDITSGLDYLHSIPLIHADLKSQNVLLINVPNTPSYYSSQPTIAKLSDFGLSLLKSDTETTQSKVTNQKQQPVGATLRYAAPEVICGEMLNTSEMLKGDIYSVGLVIMELAVERICFENLTVPQLMKQVGEKGTKPAAPPGLLLNKKLEEMLHQCWSFNPIQRPDAAQLKKMASALPGILDEE